MQRGEANTVVVFFDLNFLCAPVLAFAIFHVARYNSCFARMLSVPALIGLGDMSYSIYLIYAWTISIFFHPVRELYFVWWLESFMRIIGAIGLTLVTAYATYHLIEVPSRSWLRQKLGALIGAAFGDRAGRSDPGSTKGRWKWQYGTPGKLAFAAVAILLLVTVATAGQASQSSAVWRELAYIVYGRGIRVITATYGINCSSHPEHAPYINTAFTGNATEGMRRLCDKRSRCTLPFDFQIAGDPANGCAKDFSVAYRCVGAPGSRAPVKWLHLPAEAFGKVLELQCLR